MAVAATTRVKLDRLERPAIRRARAEIVNYSSYWRSTFLDGRADHRHLLAFGFGFGSLVSRVRA